MTATSGVRAVELLGSLILSLVGNYSLLVAENDRVRTGLHGGGGDTLTD